MVHDFQKLDLVFPSSTIYSNKYFYSVVTMEMICAGVSGVEIPLLLLPGNILKYKCTTVLCGSFVEFQTQTQLAKTMAALKERQVYWDGVYL